MTETVVTKKCFCCKEDKPVDDFVQHKGKIMSYCLECNKLKAKAYYARNKDKMNDYSNTYFKENKLKFRQYAKAYRARHRDKITTKNRARNKVKILVDPRFALDRRVGGYLTTVMRGGILRSKYSTILGYTPTELRLHMERHFLPGMSWANYGEWQIDHIVPKSAFPYTSTEETAFVKCWELYNLRPIWTHINLSKGSGLDLQHDKLAEMYDCGFGI